MRAILALFLVLSSLASASPAFSASGWIVIVSSVPTGSRFDGASARAAEACGVETAEGDTWPGSGFRPGTTILFSGPYSSKRIAEATLRRVLPCVPDAYVKSGDL